MDSAGQFINTNIDKTLLSLSASSATINVVLLQTPIPTPSFPSSVAHSKASPSQ